MTEFKPGETEQPVANWKSLVKSLLLTGTVVLGTVRPTQAATITVTRMDDVVATDDGVTLREAIQAANTNTSVDGSAAGSGADIIVFDPTVFTQNVQIGLSSELTISSDVTITGPGADLLFLNGSNAFRVFNCTAADSIVAISGLTLTGCNTGADGGAVRSARAILSLKSCVITGNSGARGGAVYADGGKLSLAECTIEGNTATNRRGGGIHILNGELNVVDCTISGNVATGGGGGGIFARGTGAKKIDRSTFFNNSGNYGGGVYFRDGAADSIVSNSTFAANNAVFNANGNQSAGGGGALLLYNGNLTVLNCTITGNTAAQTRGGGMHVKNNSYGGGNLAATVQLTNTILSGNTDSGGSTDLTRFVNANVTIDAKNNLVQTPGANAINGVNSSNITGTDPQLGPLRNNGGNTQTCAPALGSPVLEAGTDTGVTPLDQRGVFRTVGTTDIGAIELFTIPNTITVDNLSNVNDGEFFAAGSMSLPEAVLLSNTAIGANTIGFASGLTGTITLDSKALPILDSVTITGPGVGVLTVSGGGKSRVFTIDDEDGVPNNKEVTILGLRIADGKSDNGGGIFNVEKLTLNDVEIANCKATQSGGGIFVERASLDLADSVISGNTAGNKGGGIWAYDSAVSIQLSTLTGNGSGNRGGGIFLYGSIQPEADDPVSVTIEDSTISDNTSGNRGGGLHLLRVAANFTNVTIAGNTATNRGGGIQLYRSVTSMSDCTISGNTSNSPSGGGGGLNLYLGSAAIANTTISENRVPAATGKGGGAFLYAPSSAIFENCTISGNSSGGPGSNVFVKDALTVATIRNSTITGAITSDGITVDNGSLTLRSTLVAGNLPADVVGTVDASSDHNLVGIAGSIGISNADANSNKVGSGGSPIDAKLGPLANNGGATKTHKLLIGSPAINAGSNAAGLSFDQRGPGFQRVRGGTPDIGAFEAPVPPVISSANAVPTGLSVQFTAAATDPDGGSLTYSWDFGDGLTGSGQSVTHVYTSAGTYTATLTVSNGLDHTTQTFTLTLSGPANDIDGDGFDNGIETALGSNANNSTSRPLNLGSPAAGSGMTIKKLQIKINPKNAKSNKLAMSGTIPLPANALLGQPMIVSVGGLVRLFALDAKGVSSKSNKLEKAKVAKPKKGFAAFTVSLSGGDYSTVAREGSNVRVIVIFNGSRFEFLAPVK